MVRYVYYVVCGCLWSPVAALAHYVTEIYAGSDTGQTDMLGHGTEFRVTPIDRFRGYDSFADA